ncbi:MAG: MMPL family transporter [Spirochaetes bacterium]|jgi:predicted RND superfamily exporter protein|nr:MMPL family transporter [Spirochaetota bacterium]
MNREHRIADAAARFVSRYRRIIPVAGIVLLALALFSASRIETNTQVKDLLPADNPMVASWEQINDEFDGGESIFMVVKGPDRDAMSRGARAFVEEFRRRPAAMELVNAINLELDREFAADWGLLLQEADDLERSLTMLEDVNLLPIIRSLNDNFETTYSADSAEEELSSTKEENDTAEMYGQMESFFVTLREYLEDPELVPAERQGRTLAELFLLGEPHSYAWDNSLLTFTIVPNISAVDFEETIELTRHIREVARQVESQHPEVSISYTGNVPIQADEQEALGFDMIVPALVALLIIFVLFLFSFQQIRSIVMTILVLVTAIVFNYGFVGAAIGEITMLTSFMSTLLLGLGIDYGIQLVTTFNAMRTEGAGPEEALRLTYRKAGTGTMLAALTTAVAFFVMALTGSQAFAQFGITAGTGVLLCFVSMVTILPSLLLLFGREDLSYSRLPKIDYGFLGRTASWIARHRRSVLAAGAIVTAGLAVAALGLRVEYNFMNLEPQDMPSIITYNELSETLGITPSQSMVIAEDIDEARELSEALEEEPLVGNVSSVSYLIPSPEQAKRRLEIIRNARGRLGNRREIDYTGTALEDLLYEIQRVEWNLIEIGDLSVASLGEDNRIVAKRNQMIREVIGAEVGEPGREVFQRLIETIESDPDTYGRRLNALDDAFSRAASDIVTRMAAVDRPVGIADLPEDYRAAFFSGRGERNLVTILPADGMFESLTAMEQFSTDLARIDERITGFVQIGLEWTQESFESSIRAGILILIVVLIALALEFRSLRWAAAAGFPLVVGMIWMLGLYPLLGMKINAINLAMVPLVIGMAVDFGIHLVHRFREEGDVAVTYSYTGKAVFLSAMTTMVGFGSLALVGEFKSIALIGAILFLGIASAWAVSLVLLPTLLRETRRVK